MEQQSVIIKTQGRVYVERVTLTGRPAGTAYDWKLEPPGEPVKVKPPDVPASGGTTEEVKPHYTG